MNRPPSPPPLAPTLAAYPRLQAEVGVEPLAPEHFFSKCLADRHSPMVLEWLDARYGSVFTCPRVTWEENRRAEIVRKLRNADDFASEDAVVQTLATLVAHPEVHVVAQAEGQREGERTADLLLVKPDVVDIEVTLLRETKSDRDVDAIESSILRRLTEAMRQRRPPVAVTVRVRRVHDDTGRVVLDPRMQKDLVREAVRLTTAPLSGAELVALAPSGEVFRYDGRRRGLHDVLATIELRPSQVWVPMSFSGMGPVTGEAETSRALKRKRERKQCAGSRPFVVVLDRTSAPFMGEDEVRAGAEVLFSDTATISAAVVQHRRLLTPGFALEPTAKWTLSFQSIAIPNPRARFPLPEAVLNLFAAGG